MELASLASLKRQRVNVSKFILNNGALIFFFLMLILNSIFTPNFLNINTFWNLIIQSSTVILVAMGMTFVISSGGIDISVGTIMAIAGMITARLLPDFGAVPALLVSMFVGIIIGLFSGSIISIFNIQPIIVTLGVMISGRGIAKIIGDGNILPIRDSNFSNIAMARFAGIPVQLFYVIVICAVFLFIAKKTVFARYIEAMGDNFNASVLAGVKVKKMIICIYMLSGFMAAIAGLLTIARAGASDPDTVGLSAELNAIAAVAIGDTPMSGGKARIIGTLVGALIMQLITITFNMNDIPYDWSLVTKTVIIILAVYIQNIKGN